MSQYANEYMKGVFLKLDRKDQIEVLKTVYKDSGFASYKYLADAALEAPCNAGGIPVEILEHLSAELMGGGK